MAAVLPKWLLVFGWESISVISLCSSDSVCLGDDDAVVASGGGGVRHGGDGAAAGLKQPEPAAATHDPRIGVGAPCVCWKQEKLSSSSVSPG